MKFARLAISIVSLGLILAIGLVVGPRPRVFAQTFIEPPAAPTGGNSALWLTAGATDERKLGSLLIGQKSATCDPADLLNRSDCSKLCLNSADINGACISSWGDAINLAGGPFVPLRITGLTAANQSDPTRYFATMTAADYGASSIQGSGPNQAYSLIAEANNDASINAGYGLFAGDGGATANFAAQFAGRVGIGNTILASGAAGPAGQLCLNSTAPYVSGNALGCIDAWGDLSIGALTGFVKLQSANPPTPEAGTAAANKVGNFGAVVFGHPPVGQPAKTFCGDGMCSTHLNEGINTDANYCPIDCSPPSQPANVVLNSSGNNLVTLSIFSQAQLPSGKVLLLLARSTNPSFMNDVRSAFIPQNGVTYSVGQVINGVTIAFSQQVNQSSGTTIFDSIPGPTIPVTYYYRLYQANLYPIYNQQPLTLQATTTPP